MIIILFTLFHLANSFYASGSGSRPDPFLDTNCDCTRFCAYECAIYPEKKQNITMYRMTMENVYGLADKDVADVRGDMSFVLNKRSGLKENSTSTTSKYQGNVENSTDLVLEMQVEVDG